MTKGPLELVGQVAAMLDELGISYALGGSLASSLIGEPRSTVDIDTAHGLKVDLFVLGEGLLDRMQIARRMSVAIPGIAHGIWVTSPEDQVLRKLDWYRSTGNQSERQWRDVLGILRNNGDVMDSGYLVETARQLDLSTLLDDATKAASSD